MDDLIPFLIFVVIVIINLVKAVVEKGGRKKAPSPSVTEAPKRKAPSLLDDFFTELAKKLEPQPIEQPVWPEGRKRPDYMQEMEAFETVQAETYEEEEPEAVVHPAPVLAKSETRIPDVPALAQKTSLKTSMRSLSSGLIAMKGMTVASAPILRSENSGHIDFSLGERAELRKAIIANLIFSPPRAYDASFNNTIAQ